MMKSLKRAETFYRVEESTEKCSYGCEQEWYNSDWQKQAGCGPSTACNILSYMEFASISKEKQDTISKNDRLLRMKEAWEHVTPTRMGIPTIKMFRDNFLNYAKAKGMDVICHSIHIRQKINSRPDLCDIIKFIEEAMLKDSPVAFLNLCNGQVSNLNEWHWVTIISIEYAENETEVYVNIIDEGRIKKIDLKLWLDTTRLGGGFIYFERD